MILLWTGLAQAATWTVDVAGGADFETISEAMLASADGDTIEVADGVYEEAVVFPSHDVVLFSIDGGAVIDSTGSDTASLTLTDNTAASEVLGFELIPDPGQPALVLNSASPLVTDLLLKDLVGLSGGQPLVQVYGGDPIFDAPIFTRLSGIDSLIYLYQGSLSITGGELSDIQGSGTLMQLYGSLYIENTQLRNNTRPGNTSNYLVVQSASSGSEVELIDNVWEQTPGFLLDVQAETVLVRGSVFTDNNQGRVSLESQGNLNTEDLTLTGTNLELVAQDLVVSGVHISDIPNADRAQGTPNLAGLNSLRVEDASFERIQTTENVAGLYAFSPQMTLTRVVIDANQGQQFAADLRAETLELTEVSVSGNSASSGLRVLADEVDIDVLWIHDNLGQVAAGAEFDVDSVRISRASFLRNQSSVAGTTLEIRADVLELRNSTFCGNQAVDGGAAAFQIYEEGLLANNAFYDNQATRSAGAVLVDDLGADDISISNNAFVANQSPDVAALMLDRRGPFRVYNNAFAHHAGTAVEMESAYYNGFWDNEENYASGESTFEQLDDPLFLDWRDDGLCGDDLATATGGPYRDTGVPTIEDLDGSISDIGLYGGPGADPDRFDGDGDGIPFAQDCDDTNPDIGGEERPYDGLDNDCDETTPDDDLDGDGYGVETDCDDQDAAIYPGVGDCVDGETGAPQDTAEEEVPSPGPESGCSCGHRPIHSAPLWPLALLLLPLLRRRPTP